MSLSFTDAAMTYLGQQIGATNKVPAGQSFLIAIAIMEAEGDDSLFLIKGTYSNGAVSNLDKSFAQITAAGGNDKFIVLKLTEGGSAYYLPCAKINSSEIVFADDIESGLKVTLSSADAVTVEDISGGSSGDVQYYIFAQEITMAQLVAGTTFQLAADRIQQLLAAIQNSLSIHVWLLVTVSGGDGLKIEVPLSLINLDTYDLAGSVSAVFDNTPMQVSCAINSDGELTVSTGFDGSLVVAGWFENGSPQIDKDAATIHAANLANVPVFLLVDDTELGNLQLGLASDNYASGGNIQFGTTTYGSGLALHVVVNVDSQDSVTFDLAAWAAQSI